jgi:scyllo-inositol 2-dehydrogenase (NADP+)
MLLHFQNDVLYQIEISNLARVDKPRWYILGENGGFIKYGLDPQEGPMVKGNIDAATEDPEQRGRVFSEANGEQKEIVIDSVKGSWKSYYQNISDVLNKSAELAVKPEEARRAMVIYDAAMKSSETREAVKVNI